jgi:hypothetical protein
MKIKKGVNMSNLIDDVLAEVDEMSDLQVLKELNLALVPSGLVNVIPREYSLNMSLLRAKLIDQRLSK